MGNESLLDNLSLFDADLLAVERLQKERARALEVMKVWKAEIDARKNADWSSFLLPKEGPLLPTQPPYPSFAAAVKAAAYEIKANIDVRNVEKFLEEKLVVMPRDARSAIATQLKLLTDADVIVRTHEGAGPIPHKYMITGR